MLIQERCSKRIPAFIKQTIYAALVVVLGYKKKGPHMKCTSPRTVGFQHDGKTLSWSPKNYSKEYPVFQLPCGKCLSCRLERARETAVRCVHEAQMHDNNCFATLTYNDTNLPPKLDYTHVQKFIKCLRDLVLRQFLADKYPGETDEVRRALWALEPKEIRKEINARNRISYLATGEYGDWKKRPHWHILIFNWRPSDQVPKYVSDRGDQVFSSKILEDLWGRGITEFGEVSFESASYCARYATKKLVHGPDGHEFEPISRRSTKNGIGRSWIEKYWGDVFNYGYVILPSGVQTSVPRYYERWLKKHKPEIWERYVTKVKSETTKLASEKEEKITQEEKKINLKRSGLKGLQNSRNNMRKTILAQKIKQLNDKQKL